MIKFDHIDTDRLMIARPGGNLDARMAEELVEFVEIKEVELENGFNRFIDFTNLEGVQLSSVDISLLARRRSAFNPNVIRVKTAILAATPLFFGIGRMYEQMLHSPRIEVRVWRDLEAAAEWLGVKPDRISEHAR